MTNMGILEARAADIEEDEDENEYGAEGDDDYGDYDEEGGEEEYGDYGDYGDYDEEEEADWPPKDQIAPSIQLEDRFFLHNETLKSKYNEVELGAFMKLLAVKPHK